MLSQQVNRTKALLGVSKQITVVHIIYTVTPVDHGQILRQNNLPQESSLDLGILMLANRV